MVATTFLHQSELNQPSGNAVLDSILATARAVTGRDYQLVVTRRKRGLFWKKAEVEYRFYVYVGGVGPWQEITAVQTEREAFAYLFGAMNSTPDWISPVEALPEPYVDVFIRRKDGTYCVGRRDSKGTWQRASYQRNRHQYTVAADEIDAWLGPHPQVGTAA